MSVCVHHSPPWGHTHAHTNTQKLLPPWHTVSGRNCSVLRDVDSKREREGHTGASFFFSTKNRDVWGERNKQWNGTEQRDYRTNWAKIMKTKWTEENKLTGGEVKNVLFSQLICFCFIFSFLPLTSVYIFSCSAHFHHAFSSASLFQAYLSYSNWQTGSLVTEMLEYSSENNDLWTSACTFWLSGDLITSDSLLVAVLFLHVLSEWIPISLPVIMMQSQCDLAETRFGKWLGTSHYHLPERKWRVYVFVCL